MRLALALIAAAFLALVEPATARALACARRPDCHDRAGAGEFAPLPEPAPDSLDEAELEDVDLRALVIANLMADAAWLRAVHAEGQRLGRNPLVFSRIGDCMTASKVVPPCSIVSDDRVGRYRAATVIDRFAGPIGARWTA